MASTMNSTRATDEQTARQHGFTVERRGNGYGLRDADGILTQPEPFATEDAAWHEASEIVFWVGR